jgi:uncharacterized protein (TIGR00296 family)
MNGTPPSELQATKSMCRHCFDVVIQHLHHTSETPNQNIANSALATTAVTAAPDFIHDLQDLEVACPLFVTWDKRRHANALSKSFDLRGCIGSLTPQKLKVALGEYSVRSAFQDHRFPPINAHELEHLRVSVSLLVNYETCQSVVDWVVGKHGIILSWKTTCGKQYSSTFLPEVAAEQKWNQKTAVESLIRKAGWTDAVTDAVTDALLTTIQCTRYQSSKLRLTFEEYVEHIQASGGAVEGLERFLAGSRPSTAGVVRANDCRIS